LAAVVAGCHAEYVDPAPAQAVASEYWGDLQRSDVPAALAHYTPALLASADSWPRMLHGMQARYGPVSIAELQDFHLVPLEEEPCYWLAFAVKRASGLPSVEGLLVCREAKDHSRWTIAGQQMERLDTHQKIQAGFVPQEAGVNVSVP
jgi:hypothetical protein